MHFLWLNFYFQNYKKMEIIFKPKKYPGNRRFPRRNTPFNQGNQLFPRRKCPLYRVELQVAFITLTQYTKYLVS